MVPTVAVQTARKMPHPVSPLQKTQITAGSSTSVGPSWAMHSMNINAVSRPANGTPAIASPMPPSTDCTMAVTPTPSATARIAWPASTTEFSPRSPASRRPKRRTVIAAPSPPEYISPASTTVSRNWATTKPAPPTSDTNHLTMSLA